jgi:hypothetical protein
MSRMMRKARKIRNKLGADSDLSEPIWEKPKGMHWRTFDRLIRLENQAHSAAISSMARWVAKRQVDLDGLPVD